MMFALLNKLQYGLWKPWRPLTKKRNETLYKLYKWFWLLPWVIKVAMYVLLTPIRFLNAVYYNVWVHGLWSIRDHISEVFNPKLNGMRRETGLKYAFFWLFGLPGRLVRHSFMAILQLVEGITFVAIDTVLPALTMYHGTKRESSIKITKPGKWLVGRGDFAGSGIYFTMDKSVARHYAERRGGEALLCARVTLGSVINLNFAPQKVYNYTKSHGTYITNWGLENKYTTVEWWRDDDQNNNSWWEYCILNKRNGRPIKTWRIRILYVQNLGTGQKERIWGGKALWVFG